MKKNKNLSSSKFKALDLTNKVINNIKFLEKTDKKENGAIIWKCQCYCGNIFYAKGYLIKNGNIKSCGCARKVFREGNFKKARQKLNENFVDGTCLSLIKTSKLRKNNKTGVTGISKRNGKYVARIMIAGKSYQLGTFSTLEEAIQARKNAEEKYFKPILDKYNHPSE